MLVGGIPTALLFLALFSPPAGMGETGIFFWLMGVSIALRTVLTIYFIPCFAMGAELSNNYVERTVIAKNRVTVAWLAGMALPAIAYALFFNRRAASTAASSRATIRTTERCLPSSLPAIFA